MIFYKYTLYIMFHLDKINKTIYFNKIQLLKEYIEIIYSSYNLNITILYLV